MKHVEPGGRLLRGATESRARRSGVRPDERNGHQRVSDDERSGGDDRLQHVGDPQPADRRQPAKQHTVLRDAAHRRRERRLAAHRPAVQHAQRLLSDIIKNAIAQVLVSPFVLIASIACLIVLAFAGADVVSDREVQSMSAFNPSMSILVRF